MTGGPLSYQGAAGGQGRERATMALTIEQLTERMQQFVRDQGWYEPGSPRPQTLRNLAMSLSIEVSELMEHVQWAESPRDRQGWREELADVLLYLMQLASLSDVSLEQAVLEKLEKNAGRTWESGT
ncbi:MAG TPA: nucleotide pyrophosphohydrolase [Anaerolineales bacterium]|nr:nucleotide pyrophosphohydrolase [Anaerolineales bacterium]